MLYLFEGPQSKEDEVKVAVHKVVDRVFVLEMPLYKGTLDQFSKELLNELNRALSLNPNAMKDEEEEENEDEEETVEVSPIVANSN
ncbi:unnamed protein product [Rodentolepis nana]|uniref:TIR-NBS-LRR resistance protein n=1 Tax=Rodentolepis nana TaxID=102285 RepID=A0A0R3TS90_RODNA|nr:unnamed protein product [Rodentolepis nana]